MTRGVVLGELWAARKAPGLEGRPLKLVALHGEPAERLTGRVVVALDALDARAGQEVLVAFGSGGRNALRAGPHNRGVLCDAAIALIIEPERS